MVSEEPLSQGEPSPVLDDVPSLQRPPDVPHCSTLGSVTSEVTGGPVLPVTQLVAAGRGVR